MRISRPSLNGGQGHSKKSHPRAFFGQAEDIADKAPRQGLENQVLEVTNIDIGSGTGLALLEALAARHGASMAQAASLASRLFLLHAAGAPGFCLVGGQAHPGRVTARAAQ